MGSLEERVFVKRGLHRSSEIERSQIPGVERATFVKVFASQGRLRGLLDGLRARREAKQLVELAALQFPVPKPDSVRKSARGWEVRMEWLEQVRTLRERLQAGSVSAVADGRLARSLGALLAHAICCNRIHGDPHLDNLLVDSSERVWLIDCAAVRSAPVRSKAQAVKVLGAWAAALRECAAARLRLRIWRECQRSLEAARLERWRPLPDFLEQVEEQGRQFRLRALARQARSWCRRSSAVTALVENQGRGWRRQTLAEASAREILSRACSPKPGPPGTWLEVPAAVGAPKVYAYVGSPALVRQLWQTLARLEMHGIPAARGLCFLEKPSGLLLASVPCAGLRRAGDFSLQRRAALALGRLLGSCQDRNYAFPASACWFEPSGTAAFLLPETPFPASTNKAPSAWRAAWPMLARSTRSARAAFLHGYLQALRGGSRERNRMIQELRGG